MSADFVHLHVHSDYSVLDGACTVKQILGRASEYGMEACALTDHGNIFGAVEFSASAKKYGVKPIIGCELYVAPAGRFDQETKHLGGFYTHLTVWCETLEGYHNLCKLSSAGYIEGFYYKPRVDHELLRKWHGGLIAGSACLGGEVPKALLQGNEKAAREAIERYIGIFGKDNFVIEIMEHGLPEETDVNPKLAALAAEYGLMLVATNDSHYLEQADAEAHEALLCVQTATNLEDENRFRFPNDQFYFRSAEEMRTAFARWPEAIESTLTLARRCDVEVPLGLKLIPSYDPPEGHTKESYLQHLVMQGLEERYAPVPPEYRARAEYELQVIDEMHFTDYFLVVWDLIRFAREQGIPVGPGRGSGAGSIVAYCLYITNIDPMRYQLLFERFLNPDRVSMPDFDIDFCYNRREEMIQYAYETYGRENVAQIVTFGRMLAKNVVRNVGRVLGMSYGEVDVIAKLIPDELKITLDKAVEKEPELKQRIDSDPQVARLWRLAKRLEGTIGNCGTHAAGVVICDHPITDHVALYKASNSETVATQVEMTWVEAVGLLKMDFLGLRTLTVVHEAVRLIREGRGIDIDIDNIETSDKKTYALLRSGQTSGVFQLESSGMRDVARRIGLQSLEEMCALVALYRPGPMQFIDTYIDNKYHPDKIAYDHPLCEPILKETYGIAIYQEQVMQLVQACGGFSLGHADIVRRAMGKKKKDLLDQQRVKFLDGCEEKDIDRKLGQAIWDKIETFAGYGFNKSHSMAYAFVAYQTAYLKANYPVEFMCALLTSESGNLDKVAVYVEECRRLKIDVRPPDVNSSCRDFTVEGNAIRFGLCAIKNVGEGPVERIVEGRSANGPFKDLFDFCGRLDTRLVNRKLIESLNKAGAFAGTGWNRRQVDASIEAALSEGQIAQRERESGQTSLFDMCGMEETAQTMHQKPDLLEWPEAELLQYEKEMLGLYVTSHPLTRHALVLERFSSLRLADLPQMKEDTMVTLGGLISTSRVFITKNGRKMAFLGLETLEGACEVTVFSDLFEEKSALLVPDALVTLSARVNFRNGEPSLIAEKVIPLEETEKHFTKAIHIRFAAEALQDNTAESLAKLLGDAKGSCDVYLHCLLPTREEVVLHATDACRVTPGRPLQRAIEGLLGEDTVFLSGGMGLPSHTKESSARPAKPRWKKG